MDKIYCADVWFSTAKEQKLFAISRGVDPKYIYAEGEGAESWATLLQSCRKGDRIGTVGGFYIIGQNSEVLKPRLAELRLAHVTPFDFESGEADGSKLYEEFVRSVMGSKAFKKDRKRHKKISAKGGHGKLEKFREGRLAEEIAGPIWAAEELIIERRLELMNPDGVTRQWTESSARRHLDHYRSN
jgi:hypothetical protein